MKISFVVVIVNNSQLDFIIDLGNWGLYSLVGLIKSICCLILGFDGHFSTFSIILFGR